MRLANQIAGNFSASTFFPPCGDQVNEAFIICLLFCLWNVDLSDFNFRLKTAFVGGRGCQFQMNNHESEMILKTGREALTF